MPAVFKSLRYNVPCEATFAISGGSLLFDRNPSPLLSEVVKNFSASSGPRAPVSDPVDGSFPPEVLSDLRSMAGFNIHIAIGLPENDVIPTLSYSDFLDLADLNAVNWRAIELKIGEKYLKISKAKGDRAMVAEVFLTRLSQHKNNKDTQNKNVLLVPGVWNELGLHSVYNLAENFLTTHLFGFGVFVAVAAHPLTTLENFSELNPHVCGNFSFPIMEKRLFSEHLIGTGERNDFTNEVEFAIVRKAKHFFFAKMKKKESEKKDYESTQKMFAAASPFSFVTYKGLPQKKKAGSAISEQFALFSVEKKFKDSFSCFLRAGIPFKPLPDSHGISPFLSQCQVYSADEKVSREKCLDIFGGDKDCSRVPLIGVAF